jgi:hypothetical protein
MPANLSQSLLARPHLSVVIGHRIGAGHEAEGEAQCAPCHCNQWETRPVPSLQETELGKARGLTQL